jgi:hypothetical protein
MVESKDGMPVATGKVNCLYEYVIDAIDGKKLSHFLDICV